MPELRAVFFDIDDTLYSTTEFTKKARLKAIDEMIRLGLAVDRETCYDMLEEIIQEFTSNDTHHFNKLMHRLPDEAKVNINELMTIAAGISGYHNTKFTNLKPFPDVIEYLPQIAHLPVKLGVISSGVGIKQAEKLVRLELEQHFDPAIILITDEIGIGKRNQELFLKACDRAEAEPGEAMNVGDNPSTDIDVAHEAGLITVLREGAGKHANDPAQHEPDYRIRDFGELYKILKADYQL
jgi:putative hydrolase of the HAD superfamily